LLYHRSDECHSGEVRQLPEHRSANRRGITESQRRPAAEEPCETTYIRLYDSLGGAAGNKKNPAASGGV